MKIKISKNKVFNIIGSFMLFFKQAAAFLTMNSEKALFLGGNADPFYAIGAITFFEFGKFKKNLHYFFVFALPIIIFWVCQIVINPDINFIKSLFTVAKLMLCIGAMLFVINHIKDIDLLFVCKVYILISFVFTCLALTSLHDSFLWRFNDVINVYSLTRLQLFYLEPSELGFHIALILIYLLECYLNGNKKLLKYVMLAVFILGCTRAMGAISISIISIFLLLFIRWTRKPTVNITIIYIILFFLFIGCLIFLFQTKNPILMRVLSTVSGNDSSNNYRIGLSFQVFKSSLTDYSFLGCGFGQINTEAFVSSYAHLGLTTVVVNSFIYFFIETGLFGIIYLFILTAALLKSCMKDSLTIKWGLFLFLMIYQLAGSHFTSPVNWMVYGFILSKSEHVNHKRIKI